MKAHPYADKFPMLPEGELAELAESIRANGLRQAVVVTPDGLILDGRNRAAACERIGIEPETVVYDGDDLAEYVIDANITRRNMSTGARAMSTALVLAADGRRTDGKWNGARGRGVIRPESGTNPKTWNNLLSQAGVILDFAPDLAGYVVDGTTTLNDAFTQAEKRRDSERTRLEAEERLRLEEEEAQAFIEDNAPELAEQVGDTFQSYVEARDIWNRRNREEAERIRREKADKERRETEERKARSDLYTGMAKAALTLGDYGQYDDIAKLMGDYNPAELDPPQYARAFSPDNLRSAARFATEVAAWMEKR
jgi:hypothetical protein